MAQGFRRVLGKRGDEEIVRRYVDVNVFVYWLCGHPTFGEKAKSWIEKIEKEGNY